MSCSERKEQRGRSFILNNGRFEDNNKLKLLIVNFFFTYSDIVSYWQAPLKEYFCNYKHQNSCLSRQQSFNTPHCYSWLNCLSVMPIR